MTRVSIIKKLNAIDKNPTFKLDMEEIKYILRNWIEMHSRHAVEEISVYPTYSENVTAFISVSNSKNVQH